MSNKTITVEIFHVNRRARIREGGMGSLQGDLFNYPADYGRAGEVVLPMSIVSQDDPPANWIMVYLEAAWVASQGGLPDDVKHHGLTEWTRKRSSMVGDVFILLGKPYRVMGSGFKVLPKWCWGLGNKQPGFAIPEGLEYWTADEVAECLSYTRYLDGGRPAGDVLYVKLWKHLSEASNPTPIGGDGSEGTCEDPSERLSLANDDKAAHWWGKLNAEEQYAVAKAYANR